MENAVDENVKALILNTAAITVSSQEFTEERFSSAVVEFKKELPKIISKYNEFFKEDLFKGEEITSSELFTKTNNIIDSIKLGERILRTITEKFTPEIKDIYRIILVIIKSLSINLLDLESLGGESDKGFSSILKLLNSIFSENPDINDLKKKIRSAVKTDNLLMHQLHKAREERYGKQGIAQVSYSTVPAKAILVVGSNIRELEIILDATSSKGIDVYTHDDMMIAHTFPEFARYPHLKGQYGHGAENCLIDFATFPGPVIFTKHSLHNTDNLYRGRLFTTDFTKPRGVISIENNNFSEVISSAHDAKGFKTGKICESVTIGYDFEKNFSETEQILAAAEINKIFLIGAEIFSFEQKAYFEKLIKLADEKTLIISFSYSSERKKLIYLNACFDSFAIVRFFDRLKDYGLPLKVFIPRCDRSSISEMIYFSSFQNTEVYVGKCTPILLNPSILHVLHNHFNVKGISTVKNDLK